MGMGQGTTMETVQGTVVGTGQNTVMGTGQGTTMGTGQDRGSPCPIPPPYRGATRWWHQRRSRPLAEPCPVPVLLLQEG